MGKDIEIEVEVEIKHLEVLVSRHRKFKMLSADTGIPVKELVAKFIDDFFPKFQEKISRENSGK